MATTPNWHKIASDISEIHFNANGLAEIEVNGKIVCIARHNNQVFACTQKCPHAGASLAEGHLDALGNLVCPIHRYKFNLTNGRNVSGEGYHLKRFAIKQEENGVFICLNNP